MEPKDIKEIKTLIDLMKKHDLSVLEIEKEGFRIKFKEVRQVRQPRLRRLQRRFRPKQPSIHRRCIWFAKATESVPLREIVSPMVGTFYRAGSPDASPFVDVGKTITEETVVCIIEAMKVMNEIKAETSGVIAEVMAENGKPVQFGQVLFKVR